MDTNHEVKRLPVNEVVCSMTKKKEHDFAVNAFRVVQEATGQYKESR